MRTSGFAVQQNPLQGFQSFHNEEHRQPQQTINFDGQKDKFLLDYFHKVVNKRVRFTTIKLRVIVLGYEILPK